RLFRETSYATAYHVLRWVQEKAILSGPSNVLSPQGLSAAFAVRCVWRTDASGIIFAAPVSIAAPVCAIHSEAQHKGDSHAISTTCLRGISSCFHATDVCGPSTNSRGHGVHVPGSIGQQLAPGQWDLRSAVQAVRRPDG